MDEMETIMLNSGVEMPALGLGVFQTPPDVTRDAVQAALGSGYRHIDTAAAYGNERQVGQAVHSSDLNRSEIFLETKIWISDYGYDETLHGFEKSARKLGVDQIDLLILHQALPSQFESIVERPTCSEGNFVTPPIWFAITSYMARRNRPSPSASFPSPCSASRTPRSSGSSGSAHVGTRPNSNSTLAASMVEQGTGRAGSRSGWSIMGGDRCLG